MNTLSKSDQKLLSRLPKSVTEKEKHFLEQQWLENPSKKPEETMSAKIKQAVIANSITPLLIAAFLAPMFYPAGAQIARIAVVATWLFLTFLLLFITIGVFVVVGKIGDARQKVAERNIVAMIQRSSWLRRTTSWSLTTALFCVIAADGYLITAFSFAVGIAAVTIVLKIGQSVIREALKAEADKYFTQVGREDPQGCISV